MKNRFIPLALTLSVVAGGCYAEQTGKDTKKVLSDGTIAALEQADISIAEQAAGIVADELNLPISMVEVDSVRPVEWRDGSIGCPQPGQAYGQVITPGHKITVRADGNLYVVHEANGRAFLCKRNKAKAELTPDREFTWAAQAAVARKDLSQKIGVPEEQIIIANARPRTWPDASLGCPAPGDNKPAAMPVPGYVITLRHGSRDYTYHTDLDRVIACPAITED